MNKIQKRTALRMCDGFGSAIFNRRETVRREGVFGCTEVHSVFLSAVLMVLLHYQRVSPGSSFQPCIIHRRVHETRVHIPEQELAAHILEQCKL